MRREATHPPVPSVHEVLWLWSDFISYPHFAIGTKYNHQSQPTDEEIGWEQLSWLFEVTTWTAALEVQHNHLPQPQVGNLLSLNGQGIYCTGHAVSVDSATAVGQPSHWILTAGTVLSCGPSLSSLLSTLLQAPCLKRRASQRTKQSQLEHTQLIVF